MNTNDTFVDNIVDAFRTQMLQDKRNTYYKAVELKNAQKDFVKDLMFKYDLIATPFRDGSGVALLGERILIVMRFTDPDCATVSIYATENAVEELSEIFTSGKVYD